MSADVVPLHGDRPDYARGRQWHAIQANARKEWQAMRDLAVTVNCPPPPHGCGMPIGAACVNRGSSPPTLLKRFPAHTARIKIAKEKTA